MTKNHNQLSRTCTVNYIFRKENNLWMSHNVPTGSRDWNNDLASDHTYCSLITLSQWGITMGSPDGENFWGWISTKMHINSYQYPPLFWYKQKSGEDDIQLPLCIGRMEFFRSLFLSLWWQSVNKDASLNFNNDEPFIIRMYHESIWTWYGDTNIVWINLTTLEKFPSFSKDVNLKPSCTAGLGMSGRR